MTKEQIKTEVLNGLKDQLPGSDWDSLGSIADHITNRIVKRIFNECEKDRTGAVVRVDSIIEEIINK